MSRHVLVLVVVAIAVCVQGFPAQENDIPSAAARGDWDEVHRLLTERLKDRYGLERASFYPQVQDDVKNLKPVDGGHVYGESNFQYHSASNVNGHTDEHSGGHRVVNDNGKISEYDYKP